MARIAKPYRTSPLRRALNLVVRPLARFGLAGRHTYLLTVPGRTTGRLWSTPVTLVEEGDARWLVAPYGERNWVRNARAAGSVQLQRGRRREQFGLRELHGSESVRVLREYYARHRVTRSFFDVSRDSSDAAWLAEAPGHPVFELTAAS